MRKGILMCVVALILGMVISPVAEAANVLNTYTYDYWGDEQRSPAGYQVEEVVTGSATGTANFKNPQDLFVAPNGEIYVADTENNRVVILDKNLKFKREMVEFTQDGEKTHLSSPSGLFVSEEGEVYIVDQDNKRTLRCDQKGNVLSVYARPDSQMIAFTGIDYIPEKVVADHSGYVFILCRDMYQGAMMYTKDGEFVNYFGANKPVLSLVQQVQMLTKKYMTKEQRERINRVIPAPISNMDIDDEGFLYVSTGQAGTTTDQIRLLNPKSVNIMKKNDAIKENFANVFGDLKTKWASGRVWQTAIIDVAYDGDGLIVGLDRTYGRIFEYDTEGHLVFAFGGTGTQEGTFGYVSAIDTYDGDIYVLDAEKANITVFEETAYGEYIHKAIALYNEGFYEEAEQYWLQVVDYNCNYTLTYIGLGKIKYEQQDYLAAMEYFKLGEDRIGYGDAFKQVRNQFLREKGLPLMMGALVLIVVLYIVVKIVKKAKSKKASRTGGAQ